MKTAPSLGQPVAELGVLAQSQFRVESAGGEVQGAGQRGGRTDVGPEVEVVTAPELVGVVDQLLDVVVRLGVLHPVELVEGAGHAPLGDLLRRREVARHEPLVTESDGLFGDVVPANLGLDVLREDDHVGVQPVQDVAAAVHRADVQGVGPAPTGRVLRHPDDPAVGRPDLRQFQRRLAAVVGHYHFEQVLWVRLVAQRGQGEVERLLAVVCGNDNRDRPRRLPFANFAWLERAPIVTDQPDLMLVRIRRDAIPARHEPQSNDVQPPRRAVLADRPFRTTGRRPPVDPNVTGSEQPVPGPGK